MMNALMLECRASVARWVAPIVVVFTMIYLFSGRPWLGVWSDTVQAWNNSLALTAALVIAASAWDSRRDRKVRHVHNLGLAVRSPITIIMTRWAAGCVWWTLAFVSTQAISGAATFAVSPIHGYPWALAAVGFFAWISYAAFGVLVGRILPLFAVFPIALVVGYLATVILAVYTGKAIALFSMLDNGLVTVGYAVREPVMVGQALWFLALSATCLVLAAFLSRFPRPTIVDVVAVSGVSLVLIIAFIFLAGTPGERAVPLTDASGPRTCSTRAAISVCTWTDHAFLQPAVLQVASQTQQAVSDLYKGQMNFVETGLRLRATDLPVYISSNKADGDALASSISTSLINRLVCGTDPRKTVETNEAAIDIEQWLWIRSHPPQNQPQATSEKVNQVLKLPSKQQQLWVHSTSQHLTCGVS